MENPPIEQYNPNIKYASIERIVFIFAEKVVEEIKEHIEASGLEFIQLFPKTANRFYRIVAKKVQKEKISETQALLNSVVDQIKQIQMDSIQEEPVSEYIAKDRFIHSMAKLITDSNKDFSISEEQAFIVLDGFMKELVRRTDDDIILFDDEEISKLAKAAVSKSLEESKKNLQEAIVKILVKVSKTIIVWTYDATKMSFINLYTTGEEVPKLQHATSIDFLGQTHTITKLPVRTSASSIAQPKEQYLIYNENTHTLIAETAGKKSQQQVHLFLHAFHQGNSLLNLDVQVSLLFIEVLERINREMLHTLAQFEYDFESKPPEQLDKEIEALHNTFEVKYRMLTKYRDSLNARKREMEEYYKKDYHTYLASTFGGSLPHQVLERSGIRRVEDYIPLIERLDKFIEEHEKMSKEANTKFLEIKKAIADKNWGKVKAVYNEIKDWARMAVDLISATQGKV